MIKVITYGTFDLLHQGHINILKRAKALGDYLYVGVTTENFDVMRGKINVRQSLMERIEAVKATGLADEVFPEEYDGQKIDDIKRNNVNIFAIGSDWKGKFDYLEKYCQVIYLPRTEGVSSTQLRSDNTIRLGTVGSDPSMEKLAVAAAKIDGVSMTDVFFDEPYDASKSVYTKQYKSYSKLLDNSDAVYVASRTENHYAQIKEALLRGKHVICNSPIAHSAAQCKELFDLAAANNVLLFDSIKTAYMLAFSRLTLLVKGGIIGEVRAIDATCTSLEFNDWLRKTDYYTGFTCWGGIALLPVLMILGNNYKDISFSTINGEGIKDAFAKINLVYDEALATISVGLGVKSESDLKISGTRGYIYVPSPWWKSEYFEVRFEDRSNNKPYFYRSENEGLAMELVHFVRCVKSGETNFYIDKDLSITICDMFDKYFSRTR